MSKALKWSVGEMTLRPLTLQDGIRSLASLRNARVAKVDAFAQSCGKSGAPAQVKMSTRALGALVAANTNYFILDKTLTSTARYFGISWIPAARAHDSIACDALRNIYIRVNARRPVWAQPCPVTPVVRCALKACMRSGKPFTTQQILPLMDVELRQDFGGFIILPEIMRTARSLLRVLFSVGMLVFVSSSLIGSSVLSIAIKQLSVVVVAGHVLFVLIRLFDERAKSTGVQSRTYALMWTGVYIGILSLLLA